MSNKHNLKIAISGKSGCGNTTVSKRVAAKLKLDVVNYTFHNMADEMEIPFSELLAKAQEDYSYDRYLDRRQVEVASKGNVVLGSRLAIWLLKDADLKVFLKASPEERARRIQKREGGDFQDVLAKTRKRDERDRNRYIEIYDIDNDQYDFADLIIDTEKYNTEEIADIIVKSI